MSRREALEMVVKHASHVGSGDILLGNALLSREALPLPVRVQITTLLATAPVVEEGNTGLAIVDTKLMS